MRNRKLTRPQIDALAALYQCKIVDGWTSIYIEHKNKREHIGIWAICKEWTPDEWKNEFEIISGIETAELWQKAREGNR